MILEFICFLSFQTVPPWGTQEPLQEGSGSRGKCQMRGTTGLFLFTQSNSAISVFYILDEDIVENNTLALRRESLRLRKAVIESIRQRYLWKWWDSLGHVESFLCLCHSHVSVHGPWCPESVQRAGWGRRIWSLPQQAWLWGQPWAKLGKQKLASPCQCQLSAPAVGADTSVP